MLYYHQCTGGTLVHHLALDTRYHTYADVC
jgi:hypothetical protein